MITTLNAIREYRPCEPGWKKLLAHLGKTQADDEPLSLVTVLESNGFTDAVWCFCRLGDERACRLFGIWCARQVEHLMQDERSRKALDVGERFANGAATREEMYVASSAAWEAANCADGQAATSAAHASWDAVCGDPWSAAMSADTGVFYAAKAHLGVARTAQANELRRVFQALEAGQDPYPHKDQREEP